MRIIHQNSPRRLRLPDLHSDSEPKWILVEFESSFKHPQDWKTWKKWAVIMNVVVPLFVIPVSSTMVSPGLGIIMEEFGATSPYIRPLAVSLFIFAYSGAPLFLGPLSEILGRIPVLQMGTLFFLAFNTCVGFSRNITEFLVFRLLSGFGAGAALAVR